MLQSDSVLILVLNKTLYVNLGRLIKKGNLMINDTRGNTVFSETITDSNYEVIKLEQPQGKYWITIDWEQHQAKKSFHLK